MISLLSIDPAGMKNRATRGFAFIQYGEDGRGKQRKPVLINWSNGCTFDGFEYDIAIVEGQFANPKSSRQSLITLGFSAGFLLGSVRAKEKFVIPVFEWKGAIIPGFANAPKEMYTNNLRQLWPGVDDPHCLDAVAMGMAFARGSFSDKQLKAWRYS